MSAAAPARPAVLQAAAETETAQGGRVRAWSEVAAVWVTLSYGAASSDAAQEMRPVRIETATALMRSHPLAVAGLRLVLDSDATPWRVRQVRCDAPGRGWMTLVLDRVLG